MAKLMWDNSDDYPEDSGAMKYRGVGCGVCYSCNNLQKDMNISTYEGEGGYKKHPDTADICSSCMNGGFQGNGGRSWVRISKSESRKWVTEWNVGDSDDEEEEECEFVCSSCDKDMKDTSKPCILCGYEDEKCNE